MSFAPQNQAPDITDAIDGSITSWYDNINNCLKSSECVPGHYEYAQSPSYGNQCPIQEGGSTKIDIGCARFEIVDLNNSYIDAEFEFHLNIPTQFYDGESKVDNKAPTYYVGFKSAYDLIDQYRIYSNGDLIYSQNHSHYEGFLNYLSLTDTAKENSPCYATMKKVCASSPNVPGTYINIDHTDDLTLTVPIKFKIPLNAFPVLQNLKYFPGFMGRLQIEIYPSYKNLVWANITNSFLLEKDFQHITVLNQRAINQAQEIVRLEDDDYNPDLRDIKSFHQINTTVPNRYYNDALDETRIAYQSFTCSHSTLIKFHLYQAVYMIKMDVYNALEMNYLQIPLLFPIQTVSNTKFTYPMGTSPHFTLQNTSTLSHCDTVFVVFPRNSNERTVSFDPEIKAQLSINSKYYPREQLSTCKGDQRFINLIHDALNINNNPLMSPGKDIEDSINIYRTYTHVESANNNILDIAEAVQNEHSNFVYAVPLSTDEDFMGGISSNGSTVQIELIGTRDSYSNQRNDIDYTEAPVAIFLEDKLLKIYSMKPPGKTQIQITNATLDQIIASGGTA